MICISKKRNCERCLQKISFLKLKLVFWGWGWTIGPPPLPGARPAPSWALLIWVSSITLSSSLRLAYTYLTRINKTTVHAQKTQLSLSLWSAVPSSLVASPHNFLGFQLQHKQHWARSPKIYLHSKTDIFTCTFWWVNCHLRTISA